eukprot:Skav232520  [mRNA]  locus=scaffold1096:926666:934699:- [translate_table: standard]
MFGETPLHFAAISENVDLVKRLIAAGADALAPNTEDGIPLLWCHEVDTTAALLDGCWQQMSFTLLLLLNSKTLSAYVGCRKLEVLCKSLRNQVCEQMLHDQADFNGGSSGSVAGDMPTAQDSASQEGQSTKVRVQEEFESEDSWRQVHEENHEKEPFAAVLAPDEQDDTKYENHWESLSSESVHFTVCSAVNGEPLLDCTLNISEARIDSLLPIVRKAVSNACSVPPFGVQILHHTVLLDEMQSWEACGCPDHVFVLKKPFSLAWTEELFEAIEQKQMAQVYEFLQAGQDPNCVLQNCALTHAVIHGNASAVEILLRAGAVSDFIPVGQRHAAIHMAAIVESPACLDTLLRAQADSNLWDLNGMLPIHHAMCVETGAQGEVIDLLIHCGADVLQRDCDGDSAFSVAPSGKCVAAGMDHCWKRLTMLDVLLRQFEDLITLTPCAPVLCTCKSLSKQSAFFHWQRTHDAQGGAQCGTDAGVLSTACAGPGFLFESAPGPVGLVKRIVEVEGLGRDFVILLTKAPEFWLLIPSPFLEISDEDWNSGLVLARSRFQSVIAERRFKQADLADISRVYKRIDAYAIHLRKHATQILKNPDSLYFCPNPCDLSVTKREWERDLHFLRTIWRGDALHWVILLRRYSENFMRLGCGHKFWQTCRVLHKRFARLGPSAGVVDGASYSLLCGLDDSQASEERSQQDEELHGHELEASAAVGAAGGARPVLQPSQLEPSQPEPSQPSVKEEPGEGGPEEFDEENPLLAAVKKRRLMRGAATTRADFDNMFFQFDEHASELRLQQKDEASSNYTILSRVKEILAMVQTHYPTWSDHLARIGAAAASSYRVRLSDRLFMGDNAFFLWLVEGERYIRVHDGFCYIYNENGAFLPYTGIPPQAVLVRLATFFTHLEGAFRRMDQGTKRTDLAILEALARDVARCGTEESFLKACEEAAIWQKGPPDQVSHLEEQEDEREADGEPVPPRGDGKPTEAWTVALAKRVWKVGLSIRGELMHEKLVSLLVEWCETPQERKPCVSYADTCVQYDVSRELSLRHIVKAAGNDCYVFIPHPLLDPVLQQHKDRLHKFYRQTFWANNEVFLCHMAALALAKRGFNVDRCFIGISPGGVGQSLFSFHLDVMLAHNHGYFDPNVWYNEDELRKQVESFARCLVVTGQEAPESHKKMHMDLFKKTMSGDGIAGRKPYGYTTRMFKILGWKRLEVNRIMAFAGITKANFQSIMRRGFVWKPKARFHPDSILKQAHADHEADGLFQADPTLKSFLGSAGACAAGLHVQHAFESQHSQSDCVQMIEDYTAGGDEFLTEDTLRRACGLTLRMRHQEADGAGVGLLVVSDSQEERDIEEKQYSILRDVLVQSLLTSRLSDITIWEFKKVQVDPHDKPHACNKVLFEQLQARGLMQKGCRKGKSKEVIQPVLMCEKKLEDVIRTGMAKVDVSFQEQLNVVQLGAYLNANPCRGNNVATFIEYFENCVKERSRRGRLSVEDQSKRQSLQEKLQKLKASENLCQEYVSRYSAVEEQGRSPLRRARGKTPLPAEGFVSVSVKYAYSSMRQIRCRRYAAGIGVQKCPRRIQAKLCSHTVDLDIENCCGNLVLQLVAKLQPKPGMPEDAANALRRWTQGRKDVCLQDLRLSEAEGKQIVTSVLSGGAPPQSHKDEPFLLSMQKASIYLRWLACSLLKDDYAELEKSSDKPFPGATAFFYMWAAIEDYVLEHWCAILIAKKPSHLSLHFDGVRVNRSIASDVDTLIAECEKKIQIREKRHQHFLECLANFQAEEIQNVPLELLQVPNCIPCALWHCTPASDREDCLRKLTQPGTAEHAYAAERQCRTYQQCANLLDVSIFASPGFACDEVGKYLLHSENNGSPHCVAVEIVDEGGDVWAHASDGCNLYKVPLSTMRDLAHGAIDFSTMATFRVQRPDGAAEDEADGNSNKCLLDLQAGAYQCADDMIESSEENLASAEAAFVVDDDGLVFQDTLRDSLEEEVNSYMAEIQAGNIRKMSQRFICALCPFRSFQRLDQLREHVRKHHVAKHQFVCSGTKQMKVILALHDADCVKRLCGEDFLFRSALLLRKQVQPPLNNAQTNIDKAIRLLFGKEGPVYVNEAIIGHSLSARRVLNIYYSKEFAEILYREIVLHHSNVKSIWPRLHLRALEAGNPLGNLYPLHTRHWWPIVEDVFMSAEVQGLRRNMFAALEQNNEFMSLSMDATLKVCMAVQGQANYRAPASKRNAACFDDAHSLRRVLTIRGSTGAVLAIHAVPDESAPTVACALESLFSTDSLAQVRFLATDSPSPKLFRSLKETCPNLECLSLDPVHLAIVYEYAQWGKRSPGSRILRKVLNKFNQIDGTLDESWMPWGHFFKGENPPNLTREEIRAREAILHGNMSKPRATRILDQLAGDTPLYSLMTFIEALAAICVCFPDEVSRKVTGSNKEVRKILWAATAPERAQWLLNNLRARHALPSWQRHLVPSGTASNEALHAEINSWSRSIRTVHQSTLRLKLDIMQHGKLLAHYVASYFPSLRQFQESILLARCLGSQMWADEAWAQFCQGREKAILPMHRGRLKEAAKVQAWNAKSQPKKLGAPNKKKRTVHTVARKRSIRSQGCKDTKKK